MISVGVGKERRVASRAGGRRRRLLQPRHAGEGALRFRRRPSIRDVPALLFCAGAGDETRTRDPLLGKLEVIGGICEGVRVLTRAALSLAVLLALAAVGGVVVIYVVGRGVPWAEGVGIGLFGIVAGLAALALWPREI